ncbi:MAG TPA: HD domain-containing protein [Patescibacteria group bacterium]
MYTNKINLEKIPREVQEIIGRFQKSGADIYVVGGAVRDLLLGREVKDWDFTTNLTPEEMKKLYPKNSFCNNNFGTFTIVGENNALYEVTTYRTEQGYSDARHPDEVKWGKSLKEDLQRRDFTINALALETGKNDYQIIDYYGGEEDLKNKMIKTVGNADERFSEDALRMMRAIRLAAQLGFLIENDTFESIQKNAAKIQKISGERIRDELFKILLAQSPADGIRLLKNSGLLKEIMPETLAGVEVAQKGHHIDDVWTHNLKTLANISSNDPVTRLAGFLHDVGKPMVMKGEGEARTFHNHEVSGARIAVGIGKRLRLSNKQLDKLFKLVRWHMFTTSELQTDKAVRRIIRNVTPENLEDLISLRRADRVGSGAAETSWRWEKLKKRFDEVQKQPFSIKDLKINGEDVMKTLQIKPGRKVGEVLTQLFKEVEEKPELNERETLLKMIREFGDR